ncbi:MAG: aminotransferase class V-fold PLP-dependent enzyme [Ruminococcus sp.]|nr:aminotransferase class V-fold PLP-dependent enzyme [Ruminococcus sp.]
MIYDKIKSNTKLPFHMPGHKRNTQMLGDDLPYDIDITEIKGFDNLHSPSGILLELNNKLNKLYNAKRSYALVNGSTVGILAAVNSIAKEGDTILMARNSHKSVYNAVEIAKANVEYVLPEYDEFGIAKGITAEQVNSKINDSIKLVIMTSPTYEGVESEVDVICNIAHKRNIPVLIDAAHGAHLFDSYHNADIVIRGLHKTLPALTQCAAANIYGNLVDPKQFEIKLSMFETSSPSYVLLSSIEKCVEFINGEKFDEYYKRLNDFYSIILNNLKLLKYDDIGKLVVFTGYTSITGYELADMLRDNNIEPEMATQDYIIALTSVCDRISNLNELKIVLEKIDKTLNKGDYTPNIITQLPKKVYNSFEIDNDIIAVDLKDSIGKVSAEYIWAYPPGIPIIVPGEEISKEIAEYIINNKQTDFQSTYGLLTQKIYCKKV